MSTAICYRLSFYLIIITFVAPTLAKTIDYNVSTIKSEFSAFVSGSPQFVKLVVAFFDLSVSADDSSTNLASLYKTYTSTSSKFANIFFVCL